MKKIVPRRVLKQLFYSFIHSKYTYGIICYGSAYQNQTQRVKNLVRRALKIVLNCDTLTPEICKQGGIFDFDMAYYVMDPLIKTKRKGLKIWLEGP